jgi:hypothetical protein
MADHADAVARQLRVEFPHLSPEVSGEVKGGEGVFGQVAAGAAMADGERQRSRRWPAVATSEFEGIARGHGQPMSRSNTRMPSTPPSARTTIRAPIAW